MSVNLEGSDPGVKVLAMLLAYIVSVIVLGYATVASVMVYRWLT